MNDKHYMKPAGYEHVWTVNRGEHILLNTNTNNYEVWAASKNHASYGLIYKNTHLEFARSLDADDAWQTAIDWQTWQSEQALSYGELADWQALFREIQIIMKYGLQSSLYRRPRDDKLDTIDHL